MKMKPLVLATAITASGLFAVSAYAVDGTLTVSGQIVAATCTINAGKPDITVTLPDATTGELLANGDTAHPTDFAITLTNCAGILNSLDGSPATLVTATFTGGTSDAASGRLTNTGLATNVDLQITDSSGNPLDLITGLTPIAIDGTGGATLNYKVRYYATGASTPGTVRGTTQYTLVYS